MRCLLDIQVKISSLKLGNIKKILEMRRNEVSPGDVKSGIADTQMNFKIMSPRM